VVVTEDVLNAGQLSGGLARLLSHDRRRELGRITNPLDLDAQTVEALVVGRIALPIYLAAKIAQRFLHQARNNLCGRSLPGASSEWGCGDEVGGLVQHGGAARRAQGG
jgi:hypothetical protein